MVGLLDNYLRFHETALTLRAARQDLLASNIANADTPQFKARDIDFAAALNGAMGKGVERPALATTAAAHQQAQATVGPGGAPLLYRTIQQGSIDGNTVDMDAERNQFTDNAIRYEASVMFVTARIKGLLSAIQG